MVREIKEKYGLSSSDVLSAILRVPRHKFVPKEKQKVTYEDAPVPIGYGQTMSQPYTVAMMTYLLLGNKEKGIGKKKLKKVLEIGTGSGYQAAVLSKFFNQVYTIEIIPELAERASSTLARMGYKNVFVKKGSGEWGWKEKAPYDAVMVTAGVEKVPDELFEQLKVGGILVAPVGKGNDKVMTRFTKLRNKRTEKLKNGKTLRLRSGQTKQPSNQTPKLFTEEFGTFHFVPFVEEGV